METNILRSIIFLIILTFTHSTKNPWPKALPEHNFQEYGLALGAIFGMGVRLQLLLKTSTKENFIVSPLSAASVIGQLMLGAEGEVRERLYELLSLPNLNHEKRNKELTYIKFHIQMSKLLAALRETSDDYTLNVSDALFYNSLIVLTEDFKNSLYQLYETEVQPVNFFSDNATFIINDWISLSTNGMITSILNSPPPSITMALFLNAVYFRAEWETKFSDELNTISPFFIDEFTKVNTMYMQEQIIEIPYAEAKDYRMICLPYLKKKFGMYILFPNKNNTFKYDIKKFAQSIDLKDLTESLMNLKSRDVLVKIPKLTLSNRFSILEPLRKYAAAQNVHATSTGTKQGDPLEVIKSEVMNIANNFGVQEADDIYLYGASQGLPVRVSDIIQQTVFSIHENGTEAASVTFSFTDRMGSAKLVVLNRPFAFFIRHEETFATIFWGTISNPLQT